MPAWQGLAGDHQISLLWLFCHRARLDDERTGYGLPTALLPSPLTASPGASSGLSLADQWCLPRLCYSHLLPHRDGNTVGRRELTGSAFTLACVSRTSGWLLKADTTDSTC